MKRFFRSGRARRLLRAATMPSARQASSPNLGDEVGTNVINFQGTCRQLLGNVVESAGAERHERGFRVLLRNRTDHNDGTRKAVHDTAQRLYSVQTGHIDIESDDI